jgi:hypothetical protein
LRGDFEPEARGATSLIAKEVLGIQLDNLASTLTEEEKPYVKMRQLARARVRVRDLAAEDLIVSDVEADKIDANTAAQQQAQTDIQNRRMEAEIKEIQSATLKGVSQAGKNTTASDATKAKIILDALEKDLPIEQILAMVAQVDAGTAPAPAAVSAQEQAPLPLAAAMPAR